MVRKLKKTAPKSEDSGAVKKICKNCEPVILEYVDELSDITCELRTISNLCRGVTNTEFVDENTLIQIGAMLDRLLDKQNIIKHYFFEEPLYDFIDESVVAGELLRLKTKRSDE